MEHYAGIDVSLELSSVCVVDAQGKIVKEARVASEPDALVAFFDELGFAVKRIGLEAGPLSQWLHAGLTRAGFETVLLETRHVKAALSAMTVKTDRKDARGLAQPRPDVAQALNLSEAGASNVAFEGALSCIPGEPLLVVAVTQNDLYAALNQATRPLGCPS